MHLHISDLLRFPFQRFKSPALESKSLSLTYSMSSNCSLNQTILSDEVINRVSCPECTSGTKRWQDCYTTAPWLIPHVPIVPCRRPELFTDCCGSSHHQWTSCSGLTASVGQVSLYNSKHVNQFWHSPLHIFSYFS